MIQIDIPVLLVLLLNDGELMIVSKSDSEDVAGKNKQKHVISKNNINASS
jgi:hypothetical protein